MSQRDIFDFYSDPSHGWLGVPSGMIGELGIGEQISKRSYVPGDYTYLEEDCDALKFIMAMENRGTPIDEQKDIREHHTYSRSEIRNFRRYSKQGKRQCLQ